MVATRSKLFASVSLDLDNQWSYMKSSGKGDWTTFPSYLETAIPRSLEFLKRNELKITYFVVGQDAVLPKNRDVISEISSAGHEIGNHSFNHEPWLHLYSKQELIDDIEKAEEAIYFATGQKPIGFRAPGFSLSPTVVQVLVDRGYEYDCSVFPTYLGPVARAYFSLKSGPMDPAEKKKRKRLFGKFSDGFQTLHPYRWKIGTKHIVELPVTTLPGIKIPVHASYLVYLATFSRRAAIVYWKTALNLCLFRGVEPSFLLHALDFMGIDDLPELGYFPGMSLKAQDKLDLLDELIFHFTRRFEVVNLQKHVENVINNSVRNQIPLIEHFVT